jgi:hypothetical protein
VRWLPTCGNAPRRGRGDTTPGGRTGDLDSRFASPAPRGDLREKIGTFGRSGRVRWERPCLIERVVTMPLNEKVQWLPAPTTAPRVETGAVQFGNDWPGLFIRGDNAFALMCQIRRLADLLKDHPNAEVAFILREFAEYAELIENDVTVR